MRLSILLVATVLLLPSCNREPPPTGSEPASTPKDAPDAEEDGESKPDPGPTPKRKPLVEPLELPAELDEPELPADGEKIVVQLPPVPSFDGAARIDKYEAGEWSIAGLRKDIDARVEEGNAGTEIEVRAYVQEIYVPPMCPAGDVCPPPKQPHVWVVDDAAEKGKRNAMLVVSYAFMIPEWDAKRWEGEPEVVLEVGKQYTFKGKFKQFSDTGFASDRGLLEFVAVRYEPGGPWVYPPGAYWHPVEIARQEEENRKLAEKAAEAAREHAR